MNARVERLMVRPVRIHVLGSLLTVITIAGLTGGALLVADPSGRLLSMSAADLGRAPFGDYLIPGAILLGLFGVLPIPVLLGLRKERQWAREVTGMLGAALAIWITAQIVWVGLVTPLQPIIWLVGVILLSFGGAPAWRTMTDAKRGAG
jgi:hypothetical protein